MASVAHLDLLARQMLLREILVLERQSMKKRKIEVKTLSGSIYILDADEMTWERVAITNQSGYVRTRSGMLNSWPKVEIGQGLVLIGPSLTPGMDGRMVYTSDVVSFKEL